MNRIDDFIIDRFFQPIADALAGWKSCYGIATFLLTGFMLEDIASSFCQKKYFLLFMMPLWAMPMMLRAYRLEQNPPRCVLPVERVSRQIIRWCYYIVIVPLGVAEIIVSIAPIDTAVFKASVTPVETIDAIAGLALVAAECFLACRANPPLERRRTLAMVGAG